jgi:hypothetical protein
VQPTRQLKICHCATTQILRPSTADPKKAGYLQDHLSYVTQKMSSNLSASAQTLHHLHPYNQKQAYCSGHQASITLRTSLQVALSFLDTIALLGAKRPSRKIWTVTDSKLGMYGEHSEPHVESVFRSLSGFEVSCNAQDVMFTEIEAQWFGGDFSKERLQPLSDELLKLQLFPELEKITTDTMRIDFGTHWAHILRHKVRDSSNQSS